MRCALPQIFNHYTNRDPPDGGRKRSRREGAAGIELEENNPLWVKGVSTRCSSPQASTSKRKWSHFGCPGNTKIKCGNENAGYNVNKIFLGRKVSDMRNEVYHSNMQKTHINRSNREFPRGRSLAMKTRGIHCQFCPSQGLARIKGDFL